MSLNRRTLIGGAALLAGAAAWRYWPRSLMVLADAAPVLSPPDAPLKTYHLGHSLVGRDMPAMLAQLAGHEYASQLGWGTSLRQHWLGPDAINGYAQENAHDHFRPVSDLETGGYDALILTEMVDIRDAVRYHDSAEYLARWAARARKDNPEIRVYLYETWPHRENDSEWLARIKEDHELHWQDNILREAAATAGPIHLIPAGQVVAAYLAQGGKAVDLMARTAEGGSDTIHLGDKGNYLVALAHYATLYQRDPAGLPVQLKRADGTLADAPDAQEAAAMQNTVWDVVSSHPATGIAP